MKNTNKKTLFIGFISLVLAFGLIGGGIALLSKGLKKAEETLDNAFGKLETGAADTSTDSSAESVPADDTKLTYAEGELYAGYRINSSGGFSVYTVTADGLKANTTYKVSWSFDSTYESYGLYIPYQTINGVNTPYFWYSLSSSYITQNIIKPINGTSESTLITNSMEIQTDSHGYIEITVFRSDDVTAEAVKSKGAAFKTLINYVEIEEVT